MTHCVVSGTWVQLSPPPCEGQLCLEGLDEGEQISSWGCLLAPLSVSMLLEWLDSPQLLGEVLGSEL